MKKNLYGLYIIAYGLWIKLFKKKDLKAQTKFLRAVAKYSSMVIVITALAIACTGNPLAVGGGEPLEEEEVPKFVPGDWKAGLLRFQVEPTPEVTTLETTKLDNPSKDSSTDKSIKLQESKNPEATPTTQASAEVPKSEIVLIADFEQPIVVCINMACANRINTEQSFRGSSIPGWTITEGVAGLWRTNLKSPIEEQSQYLDLSGIIETRVDIKPNHNFILFFEAGMNKICKEDKKELRARWNGEELVLLTLKNELRAKYQIDVISTNEPSTLSFESIDPSDCGPTLDNISILDMGLIEGFEELESESESESETVTVSSDGTIVLGTPTSQAVAFGNGSTQIEVRAVQGNPQRIQVCLTDCEVLGEVWYYGGTDSYASIVKFSSSGAVISYEDNLRILKLESYLSSPASTAVPTPTPQAITTTDSILPTPTPTPTPPGPTSPQEGQLTPDGQQIFRNGVWELIKSPTPTPIPPPPTPSPSKYDIPGHATTLTTGNVIDFSQPPILTGNILSFKGKVLTLEEPSAVQLWNTNGETDSINSDALNDPNICSSEQPGIFWRKTAEIGYAYANDSVSIDWTYCVNTRPNLQIGYEIPSTNTVPWEDSIKWTFNETNGEFTFEGDKTDGDPNEYGVVNRYILVVIGPQGLMTRREVN